MIYILLIYTNKTTEAQRGCLTSLISHSWLVLQQPKLSPLVGLRKLKLLASNQDMEEKAASAAEIRGPSCE